MIPTHIHCHQCEHNTPVDPEASPSEIGDMACEQCLEYDVEDPYCVIPVNIAPCPNGITRADWLAGVTAGCDSDDHNWGTGMHEVEL